MMTMVLLYFVVGVAVTLIAISRGRVVDRYDTDTTALMSFAVTALIWPAAMVLFTLGGLGRALRRLSPEAREYL